MIWLSEQPGYTVEYKTRDSEEFTYVNGKWSARSGPFRTFDYRYKPWRSLPETARLSKDLYKEYDQWRKNFYSV